MAMSGYDFAQDDSFGYGGPRAPYGDLGGSSYLGAGRGLAGGYLGREDPALDQTWSLGQARPQGQGQGQGRPQGQLGPPGGAGPGGAAGPTQPQPPVDKSMELIRSNEPQFKAIQDMREDFIRKHPVAFFPASAEFFDDIQTYKDKLEINLFPIKPEHFAHQDLQMELANCKKYVIHSNKIGDISRGHAVLHFRTADQASKAFQHLEGALGNEVRVSRKLTPDQFEAVRRSQLSKDGIDTLEDTMLLAATVLYVSNLPSDTVAVDLSMLFPTAKDIMIFPAAIVGNYGFAYIVFPDIRETQDAFRATLDHDEPLRVKGQPIAVSMNLAHENSAYADILDRNTRTMMFETLRRGRELTLSKEGEDNPIYVTRMLEKLCRMMCRDYVRVERDEEAREHLGLPRNLPYLNKLIPDIYLERWRLYDDMGKLIAPPRHPKGPRGGRPKPYDRPELSMGDYDDYAPPSRDFRPLPASDYQDYY